MFRYCELDATRSAFLQKEYGTDFGGIELFSLAVRPSKYKMPIRVFLVDGAVTDLIPLGGKRFQPRSLSQP